MNGNMDSLDPGSSGRDGQISCHPNDGDNDLWETPIVRDGNGKVIGASLFLTKGDLDILGIETESISKINYRIAGCGQIELLYINDGD